MIEYVISFVKQELKKKDGDAYFCRILMANFCFGLDSLSVTMVIDFLAELINCTNFL